MSTSLSSSMPDLRVISNSAVLRTPGSESPDQPSPDPVEASASGLASVFAEASVTTGFAGSFSSISGLGAAGAGAGTAFLDDDPKNEARKPFFFGAIVC